MALIPAGFMRYILDEVTSLGATFLRFLCSFQAQRCRIALSSGSSTASRPDPALLQAPQVRMPDDRARDDLNGAVNLRSDATTPSKANRQRNRCVQQRCRWANHQPRPAVNMEAAATPITSAAMAAASHRRQSNGGSL